MSQNAPARNPPFDGGLLLLGRASGPSYWVKPMMRVVRMSRLSFHAWSVVTIST
jgi:hypothetical protein